MSIKPVFKLLLVAALLVMAWAVGASSPADATCGLHETDYYSTGGNCVYTCNFQEFCHGNVSGTITKIVYGQCYPCT
jgi:hypothetical protein